MYVLSLIWPFYFFQLITKSHILSLEKLQKSHISVSSVHNKFTEQVSQIVFWAHFIWPFYFKNLLQLYVDLTVLRKTYEENLQKSSYSGSSVHKYHKSCSELIWPLTPTVWG